MKKSPPSRPRRSLEFDIHFRIQEDMRGDVEFLLESTRSHSIGELFRFLIRQAKASAARK